jgi:hypothetical protein
LRDHHRRYGERALSYGKYDLNAYPDAVRSLGRYPLFNGPDICIVVGDRGLLYDAVDTSLYGEHAVTGVAYHLHNWFPDLSILRKKYMTYGHADKHVMKKTLTQMSEDLDLLVRCTRDLGNSANTKQWKRDYFDEGQKIKGNRPIFFLNKSYSTLRHKLVKKNSPQRSRIRDQLQ